jgi:hypothetical protein
MITTSETIGKIAAAVATASADIGAAKKDAKNPHFKNDYATLESAINASKGALQAQGVFVVQSPGEMGEGQGTFVLNVVTRLVHSSGEWIETVCHIPLQKKDAQGVGSAVTYGRRYGLMAALNIPASDDDGNDACKPEPVKKITPAQVVQLQDLADEVGADMAKLKKYIGVSVMTEIKAADFDRVRELLERKRPAAEKGGDA